MATTAGVHLMPSHLGIVQSARWAVVQGSSVRAIRKNRVASESGNSVNVRLGGLTRGKDFLPVIQHSGCMAVEGHKKERFESGAYLDLVIKSAIAMRPSASVFTTNTRRPLRAVITSSAT